VYRTGNSVAAVLIVLLVLLTVGCDRQPPFPTESLISQLDPEQPPGPWRPAAGPGVDPAWFAGAEGLALVRDGVRQPAAELALEDLGAIRSLIRSGALVQTAPRSILSLPVELQQGERLVYRIRHRAKRIPVTVRLLPGGGTVSGRDGVVTVPAGGGERIEIVHQQPPGTPLKLLSIDMLILDAGAAAAETERAGFFLEHGGGDSALLFHGAAFRRLVRVSRFGITAHSALLCPGDSLVFQLPEGGSACRLAFRALRPPGDEGADAGLKLELEAEGRWTPVNIWGQDQLPTGAWLELAAELPGRGERIRLTHAGSGGAVGLAEPVLLPLAGQAPRQPNLVLVVLDTLRADRLGCYGYRERPTSRRLDQAMDQWGFALFRRAHSASSWTVPATAKFMSSRYLDFHGERWIPESTIMLAEFLRVEGYYCAAFTGGGMVAVPGMEQGFHDYRWSTGFGKVEGSFPQAQAWLRQWDSGPFFLFVHTYAAPGPAGRPLRRPASVQQ